MVFLNSLPSPRNMMIKMMMVITKTLMMKMMIMMMMIRKVTMMMTMMMIMKMMMMILMKTMKNNKETWSFEEFIKEYYDVHVFDDILSCHLPLLFDHEEDMADNIVKF